MKKKYIKPDIENFVEAASEILAGSPKGKDTGDHGGKYGDGAKGNNSWDDENEDSDILSGYIHVPRSLWDD